MRFELSGSLVHPPPLVVKFDVNQNVDIQKYLDLGYTHFDVICIGGGGGQGGGIDTGNTGTLIRSYGGAGGGGGFHRVRGLLSALPISCAVVVGAAGVKGTDQVSNPALTTDGSDGGTSSFNGTACQASGGKGGKRVTTNVWPPTPTVANGGQGGLGNRSTAGGGAAGGTAGTPSATGPGVAGTPGTDGTFFQNVGQGGGGGAGGVGKYGSPATTLNASTTGGRGSYNPSDTSVYGPGDVPAVDPATGSLNTYPGAASGAKAAPLNGLPTVYGRSSSPGTVILRLTAE